MAPTGSSAASLARKYGSTWYACVPQKFTCQHRLLLDRESGELIPMSTNSSPALSTNFNNMTVREN